MVKSYVSTTNTSIKFDALVGQYCKMGLRKHMKCARHIGFKDKNLQLRKWAKK